MNLISLYRFLSRWWCQLLFFLWICALANLLERNGYTAFLRPEFGIVLGLGLAVLIGFFVAGMSKSHAPVPLTLAQALRAMILLLPLLYLLNAQGVSLDAKAFMNRSVGTPTVGAQTSGSSSDEELSLWESKNQSENFAESDQVLDQEAVPVTLLDLYDSPDLFLGKRVRFDGMWMNDENTRKDFGQNSRVLFRFVITCCAADAVPIAVVLVPEQSLGEQEESSWLQVEGVFQTRQIGLRRVPVLEHVSIAPIDKPEQP